MFSCRRCGYETVNKGNLKNHLKRKSGCNATHESVDCKTLLEEMQIPRNVCKVCEACDKGFTALSNFYRHRKTCKGKKQSSDSNKLEQRIAELEKTIIELKKEAKTNKSVVKADNTAEVATTPEVIELKKKINTLTNLLHGQQMTDIGYIYLIREREALCMSQNVYKVGMTRQEPDKRFKRLEKYKKGSEVLIVVKVNDVNNTATVEAEIKRIFGQQFVKHIDGNEYFIGNGNEMLNIIMEEVAKANK
jgi:hypothetical protein